MHRRQWVPWVSVTGLTLLALTVLSGCGGGSSSGSGGGSTATLSLAVTPSSLTVYPGSNFSVTVNATETGTTATPTITLGTLPSGLSTSASFPLSVPAGGVSIGFSAASSMTAGSYTIPISGSASSAKANASLPVQISSGTPQPAYFIGPLFREFEVVQGQSQSFQFQIGGESVYGVSLEATGLPPGVTATFSPQVVQPGDTFNVTLKASATAATTQNVQWTLTGTPDANVTAPSLALLMDVTPATGVGWSNQTSYVSTRATPFAATYDPGHQMIYASNQVWNQVEVISDKTRVQSASISIRDPRGMDLSIDGSTVWVATGSQVMYGIDTATQKATQYLLPRLGVTSTNAGGSWEGSQVYSLADGTVLVICSSDSNGGPAGAAIWNPSTNALTQLMAPTQWGSVARSGDGKHIFSLGQDELETSFTYNVTAKTFSAAVSLSSFGYGGSAAANSDGSRVAVSDANGMTLYDGNLNTIGPMAGDGGWGTIPISNLLWGGFVFSPDGSKIYEETESTLIPSIITINVATQQVVGLSPAMPVIPVFVELVPSYYMPAPFAVDSSGMVLGIQYHGIAFDDGTVNLNFSSFDPGSPTFLQHADAYSGPVAGGTTIGGFGNGFSLTPDVYYGGTKGTASLAGNGLSITSPAASQPGPVDVKMLFPDGNEVFDPQFFTYGTQIQNAIISGGPPTGGVAAKLAAFGLPIDPSGDTVTIGGNTAAVTSTLTQYPPFTGEQSAMFLSYTTPSGTPGWADLTVATPNGSGTLPRGFFFAKSVTDYSSSDSPTFVLYDKGRNQLYLSAGNHIDVFSLASNSFVAPIQAPATGANKQFQGLALTPDGKYLLAADLTDNSLAVIDPDNPSNAYAVSVATGGTNPYPACTTGPLFVAADNLGNAYVVTGAVVGIGCGPGGFQATVNLTALTSSLMNATGCPNFKGAAYVTSTGDGTTIAFAGDDEYGAFQMYSPAQASCIPSAQPAMQYSIAAAADGNVFGLVTAFVDSSGNIVGRSAYPQVLYPSAAYSAYYNYSPFDDGALQNPALNAAGSLYYWAYPNYVDIVDVQHGAPALRLGLTETVTNTVSPMAIDSGGQHIYLITNKGLTVVDLGNAPLSIGHMSQLTASAGTQIVLRGSGFQNGMTASLGGVSATLTLTDSETLTLTVPAAAAGLQDLVLTNPDLTKYTLQNAIRVQ